MRWHCEPVRLGAAHLAWEKSERQAQRIHRNHQMQSGPGFSPPAEPGLPVGRMILHDEGCNQFPLSTIFLGLHRISRLAIQGLLVDIATQSSCTCSPLDSGTRSNGAEQSNSHTFHPTPVNGEMHNSGYCQRDARPGVH
jgi:hypothetical protein